MKKDMNTSEVRSVWAAYALNDDLRMKSSSGAMFSIIAEHILEQGGIVYGVALEQNCRVAKYIRITEQENLFKVRGSKYIQAQMGETFKNVKEDLELNKLVLFTGSGCQVNGLKLFLKKDYKNLICMDVICHGVPSPKLWRKYVDYIEKKRRKKIVRINFRSKEQGWDKFGVKEYYDKDNIFVPRKQHPYMMFFLRNLCLRPVCYECPAKKNKLADLSIGDFWGINQVVAEMNDDKGISVVLIRTEKGESFFEQIESDVCIKEVSYEEGIRKNSAEFSSCKKPLGRDKFYIDMNRMGFGRLKWKYLWKPIMKERVKLFKEKYMK